MQCCFSYSDTRDLKGGMAKRSAAMDRGDMPAPDFIGLGHGTQQFMRDKALEILVDFPPPFARGD